MNKKWIAIATIAVFIAGAGLYAYFSARETLDAIEEVAGNVDVDVTMQGVELSQGREGKTDWRLKATGAEYLQDQSLVRMDKPRIIYYLDDGTGEVAVNATRGELDQDADKVRLWPDVGIQNGETTVFAERLDYDGKSRDIVLTGNVRMVRADMELYAPRVVLDLETNDLHADGGVKSIIATPQGR